ncbi:hypothetical protein GCM10022415_18080 [Knoellia locipacati]|uniref:DUF6318 domain-containing protein n=1 Tax=Knoellia locipacati TaxID=882824 RepID=A0A512T0P5_9MICO|nr:DUF6318 family protein [Knoellia locipacati]GEQ13756.1 hypothetical protein KLO01_18030 [Knoellia locipacati]
MNKTWGRAAAVLTVGALMLSGCGGDDEPTATPTPSGSASSSAPASPSSSGSGSTSPSATATPSSTAAADVPAAARARTEVGAIAFLTFFYDEVNRGQTAPGSVDLFTLSDKDCIACKKLQTSLQEFVDNGWSVKQGPVEISGAALANAATEERVIINFTFVQRPVDYYKSGASQGKLQAGTTKNAAALRWISGGWQMYDLEEL